MAAVPAKKKEGSMPRKEGRPHGRKDIKKDHRAYYYTVHFAGEQNTSATKWSTRGRTLKGGRTEGRTDGRTDGREGWKEGKGAIKEGRKRAKKKEGSMPRKEGRKERRKEGL